MEREHTIEGEQPSVIPPITPGLISTDRKVQSESVARFLNVNPAILSQFFGIGIHAFLDQILKLWPATRVQALPYLSIPALASAGLGWGIGAYAIRHPKEEMTNTPFQRIMIATMKGGCVIFPFFLGELIEVYCRELKHLDADSRCMVSEETFWEDFFMAPAILSMLYSIWNAISPTRKYLWYDSENETQTLKKKALKLFVVVADFLSKMLFYSRIIQTAMLNIDRRPMPLLYEGAALPAALIVLIGEIFQHHRHRQKIDTMMQVIMVANLIVYFTFFSREEFSKQSSDVETPHLWSFMLKVLSFPLFFLSGVFYSFYYREQYFQAREGMPKILSRKNYSLPIEQGFIAALQDPQKQDSIIQEILQDPKARNKVISKLNSMNSSDAIENAVSGQRGLEEPPITIEDVMRHPRYKEVAKIVMAHCGYEVVEDNRDQDDAELATVRGESVSYTNSADALARLQIGTTQESARTPLLFSHALTPSYHATHNSAGPSHVMPNESEEVHRPSTGVG